MFFLTEDAVREQDGEAEMFLLPFDIELLARNKPVRVAFLRKLGLISVMIGSALDPVVSEISLVGPMECGTGIHSHV